MVLTWWKNLDPDTKEKISNNGAMVGMFVKILMASFPMLFVPQECGDGPCSMVQKVNVWKSLIFLNCMTFFSFINLYYIQGTRETYMIDFFDEDDERAENFLTDEIESYPTIKSRILQLNKRLHRSNLVCVGFFLMNTIYSSGFILVERYLDTTTLTVLLTNSILVQGKLAQIHSCHTGDDLGQSSVGTRPKKYNVIDKDKRNLRSAPGSTTDFSVAGSEDVILEIPEKCDLEAPDWEEALSPPGSPAMSVSSVETLETPPPEEAVSGKDLGGDVDTPVVKPEEAVTGEKEEGK